MLDTVTFIRFPPPIQLFMLALPPLTFTKGFPLFSPPVPYQPTVEKNDLKSSPSCFRLVKDGYILKDAIFVTSPGDGAQLRLKNGRGKIFAELKDDEIHQKKDGVTLYLETSGRNYAALYSSAYKVWSSADGSRVGYNCCWKIHCGRLFDGDRSG